MGKRILFREGIKKQKGGLLGICFLVFLTVLSLTVVLAVWLNGNLYVEREMERAGYGDVTAWVSDVPDMDALESEITAQEGIEEVQRQRIIFANYETEAAESDSEGQLILWEPEESRYRFLTDDMSEYAEAPEEIRSGEVYVSPSMVSVLGVHAGDVITFPIARNGMNMEFTITGYYEDPFMGSSMIGMKGFLVSESDYEQIAETVEEEGADALAREGAMLHIFAGQHAEMTADQISQTLNTSTSLPEYTEMVHSSHTIQSFMMILQNAFCGLAAAFAIVLLLVALVVTGHNISGMVEQEWKNLGILKTIGFTGKTLIQIETAQYLMAICAGSILGVAGALPLIRLVGRMAVTTTGMLIPAGVPALPCIGVFAGILIVLGGYCLVRLGKIRDIRPMDAIRGDRELTGSKTRVFEKRRKKAAGGFRREGLALQLALRQLMNGKKRYLSACLVAALLAFFASLAERMNDWLGPDGQGMMDAFNPADLDLGVQALGELSEEEMEQTVLSHSRITDSYGLAMPDVSVNGANYTANVITEPERFHISKGETCSQADEVVLTEVLASDLGVNIGDTVTIQGDSGSGEFTVSGIYHCANDMGENLGMSREGYLSIGQDEPRIWCHHYFLEDTSQKEAITEALESAFGGDVHVHENSWPGLFGILAAMHMLLAFMYGMIILLIFVVTAMASTKILNTEQRDLAIYRSIGCSTGMLRTSFAIRFGICGAVGAAIGTACAAYFTDPLVSAVMRLAGISNFASHPTAGNMILPGAAVVLLFFLFAWFAAVKISRTDINILTTE